MISAYYLSTPIIYLLFDKDFIMVLVWILGGAVFFSIMILPCFILFHEYRKVDEGKTIRIYENKDLEINQVLIPYDAIKTVEIHRYIHGKLTTTPWKNFNFCIIRTTSRNFVITCLTMESEIIESRYSDFTKIVKRHYQSLS